MERILRDLLGLAWPRSRSLFGPDSLTLIYGISQQLQLFVGSMVSFALRYTLPATPLRVLVNYGHIVIEVRHS